MFYQVFRVKVSIVDNVQTKKSSTVHLRSSQQKRRQTLNPKKIIATCPSPLTVSSFGQKSEKTIYNVLELQYMLLLIVINFVLIKKK